MKFSLIVSTIGRYEELDRLLSSLNNQIFKNFEVIVVDQNDNELILPLVNNYSKIIDLKYIKASKGLSKSRNIGLKFAGGDVVSFPDDDCWYNSELLNNICDELSINRCDGIIGKVFDPKDPTHGYKHYPKVQKVEIKNILGSVSVGIFLRKNVFCVAGDFDESLGAGAGTNYKSGEETDLLLRLVNLKFEIYYKPEICVYHPNPNTIFNKSEYLKSFFYACGTGRVLRKNKNTTLLYLKLIVRSMGGLLISLMQFNFKKALYYLLVFCGRIWGFVN